MHLEATTCGCDKKRGLSGLGWWQGIASSLIGGALKGDGGGASAGAPGTITSVTTSTNVSPTISPMFVQQDSPQNSPVNMGAPSTGMIPGFDVAGSSFLTPTIPVNWTLLGAGLLALVGVAVVVKHGKGKRK